MAPVESSNQPLSSDSSTEDAQAALKVFWGASNGGELAYALLESQLREFDLGTAELAQLADGLPSVQGGGTTAKKVRKAHGLLERLIGTSARPDVRSLRSLLSGVDESSAG